MQRMVGASLLAMAIALTACGDDGGPTDPVLNPDIYALTIVSGGGQSGLAGTVAPDPLVVQVRRKDTSAPEEGVTVRWRVTSGSGQATRSRSATDESGRASTRVVLGNAGEVRLVAEVSGLTPVTFAALTALPAPTIQSLTPSSVNPGDTVDVRVNNLPAAMGSLVLFDGVAGEVTSQQAGTPAVLRTVVPAPAGVCGSTAQTVEVRLRVGGLTTGPASLSVTVPADPFQVGQVLVIEGTSDVQCALLSAAGGTAKYLLVALSAEFEQAGNFQLTLGGGDVAVSSVGQATPPLQQSFHDRLRAVEQRLATLGLPPAQPPASAQLFAEPQVGSTRQFWVLNNVEIGGTVTEDNFDRITATLKFVGVNTLLYIDNDAPAQGLTQTDIDFLGENYDRRLYDADVDYFGEPTDVDGNNRAIVLLTPVVNALTERDADGVIIGFFFGLDLFPPNANGCPECRFSNGAELLYGWVPDPSGQFSDARTRERVLELLPGVMVHETQHMINYRYKVFENSPPSLETLWLSEALAHMAEELGGDVADGDGLTDLADDLYGANFGRALRYLLAPDSASLTATTGQGSLGERGGWWLFTRWIADQYGDFIFRDMTQARENGVANVSARTGESFFRLFADFAVAVWADDLAIPGLADRYRVPKWQLRSIIRHTPPGGGDPEYALQPMPMTFATLRSNTTISKFLAGSSAFYVELDAAGDTQALQLELDAITQAGLAILRYE